MAPLGPLGRIIAQVVMVAGSTVGRAVIRAYRDAAQRGGSLNAKTKPSFTLRTRMTYDEATKIFGVENIVASGKKLREEEILSRFQRLYQINAPSDKMPGSPYLQKKVEIARVILLEDLQATNIKGAD